MTKDVFAMSRIITKMDIKDTIKELATQAQKGEADRIGLGIDFVLAVLGKATTKESEKELYAFIGEIIGATAKEVGEMDPEKLIALLTETIDFEQWRVFFTRVVRLSMQTF